MVSYITLTYAAKFLSRTRTLVSGRPGVLPIVRIRKIKPIAVDFTELF